MGPGGVRGARGFLGNGVVALVLCLLWCYFSGSLWIEMCRSCFAISSRCKKSLRFLVINGRVGRNWTPILSADLVSVPYIASSGAFRERSDQSGRDNWIWMPLILGFA